MTTEAPEKPNKSRAASPEITEDGFVRLHITPFDAALLKIIVPASALPNARNISYHSLETFPERRFGFVELPQMDADKIKKRLNGTVLKGTKVRVEKARPERRIEPESADETEETGKKVRGKKDGDDSERPKKRKREMGVINGVMLDDRKVKRGWTEPADYKNKKKGKDSAKDADAKGAKSTEKDQKRKQSRSKYIEKEECLLKTRMPPNEMRNLPDEDASAKKKKKKGSSRQVTVHEFEKTTKFMNFLRPAAAEINGKPATEFIEGKGWVDEDGNVVEIVKEKETPKPPPKKTPKKRRAPVESESEDESTSDSDTSSDDTSSEEESEDEPMEEADKPKAYKVIVDAKDESSEGDSSGSSSDSSEDDESETPTPETNGNATSKPLMIDIPPRPATPKAVHPLEALYKRSKPEENDATTPGAEKKAGFSFFGGEGDEEEEEEEDAIGTAMPAVPMTPYTKQDFEWRNVRSAAPTPDTVHPARMRSFFPPADEDAEMADIGEEAEEEEEGYDEEAADEDAGPAPGQQATSDFQKWFWENRRDLNRSWMTRRKTAAKEKRHRDNKARASKAA